MIDTAAVIILCAAVATWIDHLMKAKKLAPYRALKEPPERRHGRSNPRP